MAVMEINNLKDAEKSAQMIWGREKIKEAARNYIIEKLMISDALSIADNEPLIETGVVDSGSACELAAFFESAFGVEIADAEIHEDNFGTIDRMARFVELKVMHPLLP